MLELNTNNINKFKENLLKRQISFNVEKKRNEILFVSNGKKIAKVESKNSLSFSKAESNHQILNLFANVKKSINKYLVKQNFSFEKIDKEYDSSFTNRILFDYLPIGTQFYYIDVKHCYWRIAFLNGYISEKYYKKILENPDLKIYRNMALSCIIAPKSVEYYKDGVLINHIEEDTSIYKTVYENIRYKAWNTFGKLCFEKIGKDKTIGYYTDGIMVLQEDVDTVKSTLTRNRFQYRVIKCIKTKHRQWMNCDTNEFRRF